MQAHGTVVGSMQYALIYPLFAPLFEPLVLRGLIHCLEISGGLLVWCCRAQAFGWVKEMYAFAIALYAAGARGL